MSTISKTSIDNVRITINSARTKWGLASDSPSVNAGDIATASYVNTLSNKLIEAKNKSGWTGNITTVSQGNIVTDITGSLISQANSIQTHCPCHGNCTGSCTGSCTGGCSTKCGSNCRRSCNDNCSERSRT